MNPDEADAIQRQHTALRLGCGAVSLVGWSSISVTGRDRQSFLHNFCTNDVKRLSAGESCEAFFTNVKGKIVGHGMVSCRENELDVVGVPNQAPSLIEHLDRYVIREDVQLLDATNDRASVLICGDRHACVDSIRPLLNTSDRFAETTGRPRDFAAQLGGLPVHISGWFEMGVRFAALIEAAASEFQQLLAALLDGGFELCDSAVFETLRIECGLPLFNVDFTDQNLPQEVGRNEQAISFDKGCYLGQETVARIDALGHVNQQLAGVRFRGVEVPEAGSELTAAGKVVGYVTSAGFSPLVQSPLAFAMMRREFTAPGTDLHSALGPCQVTKLPLSR